MLLLLHSATITSPPPVGFLHSRAIKTRVLVIWA
nr:MAG TPA: hypothetical protein [Caudoviricetes sp.]